MKQMNREQAIKIIKDCKEKSFKRTLYTLDEYYEALDMAIKALEQEPCEDCVSRQAMLEGLACIAKAKAKSDAQKSLMGRVMFYTEQLPSVSTEKTGRWIPVSERLPECTISDIVSEDVLVFDGTDIRVGEYRCRAGYWRVFGYEIDEHVDVIAWMPLPQPYVPDTNDGKVGESEG